MSFPNTKSMTNQRDALGSRHSCCSCRKQLCERRMIFFAILSRVDTSESQRPLDSWLFGLALEFELKLHERRIEIMDKVIKRFKIKTTTAVDTAEPAV